MDNELVATLKELTEQLRVRSEDDRNFRESLLEEMRRLNRTLERIYDKEIGGPI